MQDHRPIRVDVRIDRETDTVPFRSTLDPETRAGLASGEAGIFMVIIERAHCNFSSECPHNEILATVWGVITYGFWDGRYSLPQVMRGIEEDDNERLTEIVREKLADIDLFSLTEQDRIALTGTL